MIIINLDRYYVFFGMEKRDYNWIRMCFVPPVSILEDVQSLPRTNDSVTNRSNLTATKK